jgi:tetratricopeptide (TPR) repeat protein
MLTHFMLKKFLVNTKLSITSTRIALARLRFKSAWSSMHENGCWQQRFLAPALAISMAIASLSACTLVSQDEVLRRWHAHRSSGQAAQSRGDYADARSSFEVSLHTAQAIDHDYVHKAISLKDLSGVYKRLTNPGDAEYISEAAIKLADQCAQATPSEHVRLALDELGETFNNLGDLYFQQTQYQRAISSYERGRSLLEGTLHSLPLGTPDALTAYNLGKSLCGMGQCYAAVGQIDRAAQVYTHAADERLASAMPATMRRRIAAAYSGLPGIGAIQKGKLSASLGVDMAAEEDPAILVDRYKGRGTFFLNEQQWSEAQKNLLKAQQLAELMPQRNVKLAMILKDLGISYLKQEKFSDAEAALERALHLAESAPETDTKLIGDCLLTMSAIQLENHRPDKAEPYALRRAKLILDTDGPGAMSVIQCQIFLADVYFHEKKYDEANKCYLDALRQLRNADAADRWLIGRVYNGLATVLIAQKDYESAKSYLDKALAIWLSEKRADPKGAQATQELYSSVNQLISANPKPPAKSH